MNLLKAIAFSVLSIACSGISAQSDFPEAIVADVNGQDIDLKATLSDGNPKIVSLWATWCGPCRMELNALKSSYPKWKEKYNLEIITVSVDVPQMVGRAKKMFKSNNWEYTFLHDKDQKLMDQLGLTGIPYSMLIDGHGKVISVQTGYSPAYEKIIEQKLKTLAAGK